MIILALVATGVLVWATWPLDGWHIAAAYVAVYVLISVAKRSARK